MKKIVSISTVFIFCLTLFGVSIVEAHYSPNGPHYHKKQAPQQQTTQRKSRGFGGFLEDTFGIGADRDNRAKQRHTRTRKYGKPYRNRYAEPEVEREYTGGMYHRRAQQSHQRARSDYTPPPKGRYSDKLCETAEYECIVAKRGQSWEKLFPDAKQRDIVKRLNRVNIRLRPGMKVAIPENLDEIHVLDVAPFERKIDTDGKKLIIVDLSKLAFAAYDENGIMHHWGPVSGGKDYCSDINGPCNTIEGVFSVFNKKDQRCKSNSFPVDRGGGSPMPYCMFFHSGFALHGSYEVPGYNASHGCVRMYKEDAKWLNEEFVELPEHEFDDGTEVIVKA